jgi:hypothetical protein
LDLLLADVTNLALDGDERIRGELGRLLLLCLGLELLGPCGLLYVDLLDQVRAFVTLRVCHVRPHERDAGQGHDGGTHNSSSLHGVMPLYQVSVTSGQVAAPR